MPGPFIQPLPPNLKTKGSKNETVISSLIETLQREVKPEKLYDALRTMNVDLKKIYTALFDGPLPPVDGYDLLRLNAAVLNGPLPEEYKLAYTDRANVFTRGQSIFHADELEPFLTFGFDGPDSFFRLGSIADGEFYLSQNFLWDGATWDRDDSGIGASLLQLIDGEIWYSYYDTVLADLRVAFRFSGRQIIAYNFAQDNDVSIFYITDDDVVHLGGNAAGDGSPYGWPAIPDYATGSLPASGDAACDGVIAIDKTTHKIVFYANGLRYGVVGTAF